MGLFEGLVSMISSPITTFSNMVDGDLPHEAVKNTARDIDNSFRR